VDAAHDDAGASFRNNLAASRPMPDCPTSDERNLVLELNIISPLSSNWSNGMKSRFRAQDMVVTPLRQSR